jgi:hypothetical protein
MCAHLFGHVEHALKAREVLEGSFGHFLTEGAISAVPA